MIDSIRQLARAVGTPCVALAICAAAACANTEQFSANNATGDGGQRERTGGPCTAGEHSCVGQSYLECVNGTFVEQRVCADDQACAPSLGCAECDPALGKGCSGNAVFTCDAQGKLGAKVEECLGLTCQLGQCRHSSCASGRHLIYVVDQEYRLLSFNPNKEQEHFTLIATLQCPAAASLGPTQLPATPYSMSVDRGGRAWVNYTSGEIFWVDTTNGDCKPSPFVRQQHGFGLFGMGFVVDTKGANEEHLYVVSDELYSTIGTNHLGVIDLDALALEPIGTLVAPGTLNSAELTGTGAAELYAYFPGGSAHLTKLERQTGKILDGWPLPAVTGTVRSWAFAHWGGKFYFFLSVDENSTTHSRVLQLDPITRESRVFLDNIPYRIVGAGVSTCAPLID